MKELCCLLLALASVSAVGQSFKAIPVKAGLPVWVKKFSYKDVVKDTANTSGGYFNLLYDEQYQATLKESFHHFAQKILSERGLENVSTISIDYDPTYETLTFHSIDIIRNGRRINQLVLGKFEVLKRETDLERLIYNGNLTAVFNLHDVQVGDIVEYSYSYKGSNPAFKDNFSKFHYFNFSVPVGQLKCRLTTKTDRPVTIKKFNSVPDPIVSRAGGQTIHEWSIEDIPALVGEESTPGWYDPYNYIHISDFGSWEEVSLKTFELFKPSLNAKGLANKIPNLPKDTDQAIQRAIRFVQDEVRYLSFSGGIHGFKPHSPVDIMRQRFGDCKDKSVLLCAILNELKVPSHPVLVNTNYGKAVPDHLPSPYLFNHCVVQFAYKDSVYWIDPTMTTQRGYLKKLYFPNYHHGLIIGEKEKPLALISQNLASTIALQEDFQLDSIGGGAKLHVKSTYTMQEANSMRDYFNSTSLNEIEKQYLNFYATDYPEIQKEKNITWTNDEENNIFISEEWYAISKLWSYDSAAKKYTASTYPRNLADYLVKPKTKIREGPYAISFPKNISHKINLFMPEEWPVSGAVKKVETAGFVYNSSFAQGYSKNIIELNYSYKSLKSYLEAGEVKDHLSKIDEALNDLLFNVYYTIETEKNNAFNYPFLIILVITLAASYFGFRYLYQFDPSPRPTLEAYSSIGGWLYLPAFGLCLTPLLMTFQLLTTGYFQYDMWRIVADASYASYDPPRGIFVLLEMVVNGLMLAYSVLLIYLFFKRRTNVPILISAFYITNFIVIAGDSAISMQFGVELDKETSRDIFRSFIGAAIWVPYFLISERSKGTFTVRRIRSGDQEIFTLRN